MTDTPKIRIRGLCKSFGNKIVLDRLDLDVEAGTSVVVIGGSGSGKSVLLKCILGLLTPDDGSILIDGEESVGAGGADRDRLNAKFGMLFQGAALFDSLPVWENVAFGLMAENRCGRAEARRIALAKLSQVGLAANVADAYPASLSAGMQKRVGLARAIAGDPEIIFFDEPTTGLDPIMAAVINRLIVKTTREVGATGMTITHDMKSAEIIGDQVAMLYAGSIIWSGPAKGVGQSDNAYVSQFVKGLSEGPIKVSARA
ncbi:MAG: ATP-binding cassette domain-containing protein [Rhodospirillales bacterium]